MMESCGEKRTDLPDQTPDPSTRSPRRQQRVAVMRFLEEKVLRGREVEDQSSAVLSSFLRSLEDGEWQSVQDRMVEPVSQTHLAQVSRRIIRVVSQLVLRLLARTLNQEEPQRAGSRPSALLGDHLHNYLEITEETLAESQPSARSMLAVVVEQLNLGLCVLAAQSLDHTVPEGSEVMSAAMEVLGLAGEALTYVTEEEVEVQDEDTFLETATEELMSAIADSVSSRQETDRKSGRILRDLAAKILSQHSETAELQTVDVTEVETVSESDALEKTNPLLVSSEKVSRDLSESWGSCLQVLKSLLAKFLVLFSPRSFSLMSDLHRSSLPTLESVSSDMLDIVVDAVKEICWNKKSKFPLWRHKKANVSEERVDTVAAETKVALQEKLREFLCRYKDEAKKQELEKVQKTVSVLLSNLRDKTVEFEDSKVVQRVQTVRSLLDQIQVCNNSTRIRLEDLISEGKLSNFSLMRSSGPVSPSEQVLWFSEAVVKHLLRSLLLPPPSWGMGQAIRVQSCPSSAARFAETTPLYDGIISLYTQVMCEQVMSSLSGLSAAFRLQLEVQRILDQLENADISTQKKNIVHFFQKLPNKIIIKWREATNKEDVYFSLPVDGEDETAARSEDAEDEEGDVDVSDLRKRRILDFLLTLSDGILTSFWGYEPTAWQTQSLLPI